MAPDESRLIERIRRGTGASQVELGERVQSLWGGYGDLRRVQLQGTRFTSAVVKIVNPPAEREFARDPAKTRSHRRKLRSYEIELAFYQSHATPGEPAWRVPELLFGEARAGRLLLVLEDLDHVGYPERRSHCSAGEITTCLGWLAAFHARFLGTSLEGLWKVGSYWHLATRPDELARLESAELRRAAARIDQRLNSARFRTLVHGDAKLENFCFSSAGHRVAAVDFQYVGGGVGVKDVAYFLSSCLSPEECDGHVSRYVDQYFDALRTELSVRNSPLAFDELEAEWRALFPWAWADFQRFLLGWAPAYAKREFYGERQLEAVLSALRACN